MSKVNQESRMLDEFEEELNAWDTDELLKALTATGDLYTDGEISLIQGELSNRGFAVPLKCPVCSLINPRPTEECPVCGHKFSEAGSKIPAALEHHLCSRCHRANDKDFGECAYCGHALDSALQTTRMLQDNEEQIEALARRSLRGSLMCLLFPGYSLFLAPLVIGRAMDTLSALSELHKRYPDHAPETSAKPKALTALLLGSVVFLVNVVLVILFLWAIWS